MARAQVFRAQSGPTHATKRGYVARRVTALRHVDTDSTPDLDLDPGLGVRLDSESTDSTGWSLDRSTVRDADLAGSESGYGSDVSPDGSPGRSSGRSMSLGLGRGQGQSHG